MAEKVSQEEAARLLAKPSAPETAGGLSPEKAEEKEEETVPKPEEGMEILLTSAPEIVKTARGDFSVQPMAVGQIAEFLAVAHKFLPAIAAGLRGQSKLDLPSLLAVDRSGLMRAVAIACTEVEDED